MTQSSSRSVDGVYSRAEFALSAVEDPLINKAARHFWDANNMCQARADALADVQADFDADKLKSAQDVFQYLEDESEPENELFEGIEAAVVPDSDDEKDDSDADDNGSFHINGASDGITTDRDGACA
jgi:hypothetical protein